MLQLDQIRPLQLKKLNAAAAILTPIQQITWLSWSRDGADAAASDRRRRYLRGLRTPYYLKLNLNLSVVADEFLA